MGFEEAPASAVPLLPWDSTEGSVNGHNTMQEAPKIEHVLVAGAMGWLLRCLDLLLERAGLTFQ